jgi:hypothetical protein
MDKRRFITQLPEINRTEPLKKFFGSTVDHAFQPGKPEQLSGYIGKKPSYYDPLKEFYIPEPSVIRREHQLEPIMYSAVEGGGKSLLFYEDYINYLRSNNGNVDDHNRLFSDKIYSFAPPIDYDKLNNFQQYYWFGDDPDQLPRLRLFSGYTTTIADGVQSGFPIPPAVTGIAKDRESLFVFVDGLLVDAEEDTDGLAYPAVVPPRDAEIVVYRYGSLKFAIEGLETFDVSPFNTKGVSHLTSNMRVFLDDGLWRFHGYDGLPFDEQLRKEFIGRYEFPTFGRFGWDLGIREIAWDADRRFPEFWVDGVGDKIVFVEFETTPISIDANLPIYAVIDRRSRDHNPWSRLNYWAHRDSFAWSDQKFPERSATRPIIEFIPNIELFRYGTSRLPDVQCTVTGEPRYCSVVLHRQRGVHVGRDASPPDGITLAQIPLADASGKELGTVFVDADYPLQPGDRVLVLENDNPVLRNCILTAILAADLKTLMVEVTTVPKKGDITALNPRGYIPLDAAVRDLTNQLAFDREKNATSFDKEPFDYSDLVVEYYFDGSDWQRALSRDEADRKIPSFAVYGVDHTALDPDAQYTGCSIFEFRRGTTFDKVLQSFVSHDKNGQIEFENSLVTFARVGYELYRIVGDATADDTYHTSYEVSGYNTRQTTNNGVYSVPSQLRANALNDSITIVTSAQMRDHTTAIIRGQTGFLGSPYAANNYRDTKRDITLGRSIVQQRSSLLKSMLLASDKRFDYFDAVRFAEQEYVRFKNKFAATVLDVLRSGARLATDDAALWVDTVLATMKVAKTSEFPFSLSKMVPGMYVPPTAAFMGLTPSTSPGLESDTSYATPVTMLRGHDGSRTPAFGDIRDDVLLALEQRIYDNINASFKSEDAFAAVFDWWNYVDGVNRPATTDDNLPRSRSNGCAACLPASNTAIDTTHSVASTTIASNLRYTRDEIVDMYTPIFMRWSQINGLDFRVNDGYQEADPFTWNYRGVLDRSGNAMPGHWRAIYRWYYDTDRPNEAPWEMLGFSSKPNWWEAEYGPAPYTRGNMGLWKDLRDGRIVQGERTGIDARFARPALLSIIPVDEDGVLLDPLATGIIPHAPSYIDATRSWKVGDHGPVENLWLNSASWQFARSMVSMLMRPAEWMELGWNTETRIVADRNQILPSDPRRLGQTRYGKELRKLSASHIHGESDENGVISRAGVQQWIAEYLISNARKPSDLGDAVRGIDVRLAHKMAGFTQSKNFRVFADNFGIIPEEDIEVLYHESPPIREAVYSGVIVEWTGQGYRVVGYDGSKEYFCIEPGEENGPKSLISIGQDPVVYEWKANVYYPVDRIVEHDDSTYRAIAPHTSSGTFEPEFWKAEPGVAKRFPKAYVTDIGTGTLEYVPYDTVFESIQDVAEFLRSYSRWLEKCGWVFEAVDEDTIEVQDWNTATKTFMSWAQMNWQPGNFIALSPGASSLTFVSDHGLVYGLEDVHNGIYGLLDRTGRPVARRATFVSRLDETTKIITTTENLFAARARVGEAEHVLVFSNLTIFDDVIYVPVLDLRQPRLRLLGMRSSDWTGRRDAPGYLVNGAQLLPNFEKAAEDIREMFEIEKADNPDLRDHARHVIGYQNRAYLDNLLLSETAQFEFYQGMIQQKGAPGVFNKLSRSDFIDQNRDLRFLEEWGLHVGRYGAVDKTKLASFRLISADIRNNPQYVDFSAPHQNDGIIGFAQTAESRWVEFPSGPQIFPTYNDPKVSDVTKSTEKFLPTAGYVRRDEVDHSVFRPSALPALYAANTGISITTGSRLWIYERRGDKTWDVLQGYDIGSSSNGVRFIDTVREDTVLLNTFRVTFTEPHNLVNGDIGLNILINGDTHTKPSFEGFCELIEIDSPTSVIINGTGQKGISFEENPGALVAPTLHIFRSMRFATLAEMTQFFTRFTPHLNQIVYVDDATPNKTFPKKRWAAYKFDGTVWAVYRAEPKKLETHRMASALIFDLITKQTDSALTAEPIQMDKITVLDPPAGLISGVAEKELTFKLEYDPARYSTGLNDQWGLKQVGLLWWDLSAVRYLECQTDITDSTDLVRNNAEIAYRVANWTRLAPNTSVDIYEWTRATVAPSLDNPDMAPGAQYVQKLEYDKRTNQMVTAYYFWLRNVSMAPAGVPGRNISALQVSQLLTDPIGENIPWVSPITINGLLMGGIEQYLNDSTTVFQFEVKEDDYDGVIHNEWQLMLRADKTAVPPAPIWKKLQDSLVGFDEFRFRLPDPATAPRHQIGLDIRPLQSVFDNSYAAMVAGRQSFVRMVNILLGRSNIMAERPNAVSYLKGQTPTFQKLLWSMPEGGDLIEPPPVNSYDVAVDSVEGLHVYFFDLYGEYVNGFRPWDRYSWDTVPFDFDSSLRYNYRKRSPRALLRNYTGALKTWSIWEVNQTIPDPGETFNPDNLLRIASNFDIKVADRDALKTLLTFEPPAEGTRILIESDSKANGFWTTWTYLPFSNLADTQGLVIQNSQTYDVQDFWEVTDWYAPGYSASKPPVVTYQTMVDRNNAEGIDPRNVFVRIANDGAGWAWTVFQEGHWVVVAREKGTIKLSDDLFSASRKPFGRRNSENLGDVANRDGSFELRQIIHALRQYIMTSAEINELFFSMIHFLHSAQDQIDWAFKTSFLVVRDFNERLGQPPIQTYDPTGNLLSYIEEVKPYHLKTRDFSRILTPDIDVAAVHVTDFDKPLYFDPDTQEYRTLQLSNPADALVLQTQQPWKDWYDNYLNGSFTVGDANYNPVRRLHTTLLFDRIDPGLTPLEQGYGWDYPPMDVIPFDTLWTITGYQSPSALSRMLAYYAPRLGMREKDIETLFNTHFKGLDVEGGELYVPHLPDLRDWDIKPYDTLPLETEIITDRDVDINGGLAEETQYNPYDIHRTAYGLVDPYHDPKHPEEFIPTHGNDHVAIRVKSEWVKGAPNQYTAYIRTAHIRSANIELSYQHVAQSLDAVFVYRDGVRLILNDDYTIDHFARTITVQMGSPRPRVITAHILGSAGLTPIVEQRYFDCVGGAVFELFDAPVGAVEVLVGGVLRDENTYSVTGTQVLLDPAPTSGEQVTINVYGPSDDDVAVITRTHQEILSYDIGQTWNLNYETTLTGAGHILQHIGTVVESDGVRLNPPFTRYGHFDFANNHRQLLIKPVADLSNIQVWLDGELYTGPIARGTSVADALQNDSLAPLVVVQDKLVQTNASVNSNRVVVCIFEEHEYVVHNGTLTVTKQYSKSDFDVKSSGWDTYEYDLVIPPDDGTRIVTTTWENAALMGIETHSFRGSGISEYFVPSKVPSIDYLLVTKNGKYLTPGFEFSVSPIDSRILSNYDFDSGGWDSYDHDSFMFTDSGGTLIYIPGTQIASDKIVVMAFTGDPARLPNEWVAMTKQSGLGLMGDLSFSGDWDVAPIDIFKLESSVPAVEKTDVGLRSVYKMNDTWDVIEWSYQRTGILVDDVEDDSDTITVHLNPYKVSNSLMPPQALPQPYDGSPGVIWINGERIEYYSIDQNNNTATLTELRRGTLATRTGQEQRNLAVHTSNGTTTEYPLVNADINGNIEVSLVDDTGTTTALNVGLHFSASRNGSDLLITLNEAPEAGSKILLAQSEPATIHLAGSVVRHAVPAAYERSPFMIKEDGGFWSEGVE